MVVFIVSVALGDGFWGMSSRDGLNRDGLIYHASTWGGPIDVFDEWWRVFTGGFLHHGLIHLAVNMYSLYILGLVLERTLGAASFTAVYLASLVSGSFGALIETPNSLVAGASGAIFGLLGAYAALSLAQGVGLFRTPLGPILAINLVISFTVPAVSLGGHVGGLVGGFIVGGVAALAIRRQQPTTVLVVGVAVVVAAASFLGALWAASRWPDTI